MDGLSFFTAILAYQLKKSVLIVRDWRKSDRWRKVVIFERFGHRFWIKDHFYDTIADFALLVNAKLWEIQKVAATRVEKARNLDCYFASSCFAFERSIKKHILAAHKILQVVSIFARIDVY